MLTCFNQYRLTPSLISKIYEIRIYGGAIANISNATDKFIHDFDNCGLSHLVNQREDHYGVEDVDRTLVFNKQFVDVVDFLFNHKLYIQMWHLLNNVYNFFKHCTEVDGFRLP